MGNWMHYVICVGELKPIEFIQTQTISEYIKWDKNNKSISMGFC